MQLKKFETILQKDKSDIMEFIKNNGNQEIDLDGDETDAIQAKIIAVSAAQVLAKKQDKLIKINLAMKKIADGSFGVCEDCGEEISVKRLLFNPEFNLCISCAEKNEMIGRKR